ncbi:MAG: DNA-3-methyladenine glycosylase [Bacteroidales bacterium]|nr:DNA-3-methyladenine glycosylase [Bacteroidales bacterium]
MKIDHSYFLGQDVVSLARDLLGKYIFTLKDGQLTGGIISEIEAYQGVTDRASHAYAGRRTKRNEMMYHEGGVVYMFLCYGMHAMLNFVTNVQDVPDAVLIRGIIPTHGEELMLRRTGKSHISKSLTNGPGKVSKALGLTVLDNGCALDSGTIWVEDRALAIADEDVEVTPRIGVDYAGDDALLPYRFLLKTPVSNLL